MSPYPQIITGASAEARLAELGLDADALVRTAQRARAEAATCTPLDALGAAGMMLWSRMIRFFREEMGPQGWELWRGRGSELTIHTGYGIKLLVTSGDKWTGSLVGAPQPKNPKGPTFFEAVVDNNIPLDFGPEFADPEDFTQDLLDSLTTWIIVYRMIKAGDFFLEVSRPATMDDGYVVWAERIILKVPAIDNPALNTAGPVGDDPYSLTIERLG